MSVEVTQSVPAAGSRVRHRAWRLIFPCVIALLALWFLWKVLGDEGLRAVAGRLLSLNIMLAIAAAALTITRYLTLAFRWELLARREAPLGLRQITPVLMAGNFLSLVILTAIRYVIADRVIWGSGRKVAAKVYHYNIHDIIKVRSAKRLPELGYFAATESFDNPDIDGISTGFGKKSDYDKP